MTMEMGFKEPYQSAMARYGGKQNVELDIRILHYCFRKVQTSHNRWIKLLFRIPFSLTRRSHGIELSSEMKIGPDLYMGHPYNLTINANATIGANINIHKGATIGQENRGPRAGNPTIGDNAYIGINSTVAGNIRIGNGVMIVSNAFVSCDIPDHSIVIVNPCIIKHRENATEGYVINTV